MNIDAQKKGKLYLIPTPLAEHTLEKTATAELKNVVGALQYFLVENLRSARRFISSLEIGVRIENLHLEILDKNTSYESAEALCAPLLKGENMGVLSEAGCPGIADPGNMAVAFAHKNDVEVVPLVGPSSIFMALMASGFNGQSFAFHGYLPINKHERNRAIQALEKTAVRTGQTQIFMETPYRNEQLLKDILDSCQPTTMLCVARDITGSSEMIVSRPIKEWKKIAFTLHKIPAIFIIQGS